MRVDYWINHPGYEILAGEPIEVTREIIRRMTGATMPSKSKAQKSTMRAAAHDPGYREKDGDPAEGRARVRSRRPKEGRRQAEEVMSDAWMGSLAEQGKYRRAGRSR